MNQALILCRSVTQAQRVSKELTIIGISNRIFRSSVGLTEKGCSYSVSLSEFSLASAVKMLREIHVRPIKILVRSAKGNYEEVEWE